MLFGESSDEEENSETIEKIMEESSTGNLPTGQSGANNTKRIENLENKDEASVISVT